MKKIIEKIFKWSSRLLFEHGVEIYCNCPQHGLEEKAILLTDDLEFADIVANLLRREDENKNGDIKIKTF